MSDATTSTATSTATTAAAAVPVQLARGVVPTPPPVPVAVAADRALVYGRSTRFEGLVFLTEATAAALERDLRALLSAETLREAARTSTRAVVTPLAAALSEDDPAAPAQPWDLPVTATALATALSAAGDGAWPPALPFYSHEALPAEVRECFGEPLQPARCPELCLYEVADEPSVLRVLARLGYCARRDDALVARLEPTA